MTIDAKEIALNIKQSNFKTCDQSGYCRRQRNQTPNEDNQWLVVSDSVTQSSDGHSVEFRLKNSHTGVTLQALIYSLVSGHVIRLKVNEINGLRHRFEAKDSLLPDIPLSALKLADQTADGFTLHLADTKNKAVITAKPFRIDVYSDDKLVISGNQRGLFKFEHYRPKPAESGAENEGQQPPEQQQPVEECTDSCWEESFKSHTDTKPYGPMSVGCDFTFVDFEHVYGIPEHADRFALKNTKGSSDPYRLFNVDINEYELENPMALYGAYPLMVAHSTSRTVGLLWLNPSETWIDIESANTGFSGLISNLVSGESKNKLTHWFSETGVVDVFFLLGPKSSDVMEQNAKLTGTTQLPPLYSIGYHQCRWNYWSQAEVSEVDSAADDHDIPVDAIWLDIEYTESKSKKYFTWDPHTFSDPKSLVSNLTSKGRRLITIIDPHIKKDTGYHIYTEGTKNSYFMKNNKDEDFDGWCWPGSSMWVDYLNPEAAKWWGDKFNPSHFPGFDGLVDIWNDMNEPSVFSGPEISAPRDNKHFGGVEHRDVHNMYGFLMTKATYTGLKEHRPNQRPFILTRSFFVGSQRYCAAWTGDNMSKWEHLRITIPMLLSHSIAGITFIGADIPGFFFNPESEELVVRWYQTSVFHPFFRGHAHLDTKRREPWTFSEPTKLAIRDVFRMRYQYLPLMYKLFYENERSGMPPMRPLWMTFPEDVKTFATDDAYMLGDALLVHPIQTEGQTSIEVYFPTSGSTSWIDVKNHHVYGGGHSHSIQADINTIPVFQRSGTVVPKRERMRRSAQLTVEDPISLDIFLDSNGSAEGQLYLDDGQTFNYKSGQHIYGKTQFQRKTLSYEIIDGKYDASKAWLERVTIFGYPSKPQKVVITSGEKTIQLAFKYDSQKRILVVRKPGLAFTNKWQIKVT
ncbi:unnamed protein product [Medioppia subpectinata]|uniref:Glucosidase II subunit alpha n=1 Tax=Medioppia subpectinata TaxID=1979941 RepID=A0A7R9PWQ7_9ACAR|nr:unnamed protein product [Medioppia subpectinata]CAG2104181.1 unnamed protein product [Medioppia subpectinata]